MSEELKDYFKEQCKKIDLNAEDYWDVFCEKLEKEIKSKECIIAYAKALKFKEVEAKKPKKSQADRLVEIGSKMFLFLDQYETEHVRVVLPYITNDTNDTNDNFLLLNKEIDNKNSNNNNTGQKNTVNTVNIVKHRLEVMSLESKKFKEHLADLMWQEEHKTPANGALQSAITVLSGIARRRQNKIKLHNRVAPDPNGNGFWLDIADKNWRAIHVTAEGWEIVDEPPLLFRRYTHQNALPVPVKVSEEKQAEYVNEILRLVNLPDNKNDRIMFLSGGLSYLIPNIAHPAMFASGCHGSAKSWLFWILKALIDPSKHQTLTVASARALKPAIHEQFPYLEYPKVS